MRRHNQIRIGCYFLLACLGASCSREPDDARGTQVTGSAAAVTGLPRHRAPGRFLVENCCTLQLGRSDRPLRLQGTDSTVYDVAGPGYVLHIVFGPYDDLSAADGFRAVAEHMVDGVKLGLFRWDDRTRKAPDGTLLWLAEIGGRKIGDVYHTPWGLRITAECNEEAACRPARELIGTIRF